MAISWCRPLSVGCAVAGDDVGAAGDLQVGGGARCPGTSQLHHAKARSPSLPDRTLLHEVKVVGGVVEQSGSSSFPASVALEATSAFPSKRSGCI